MTTSQPQPQPQPSSSSSTTTEGLAELPWAFIDCPLETLITLLAHMLDLLITHNDQVLLTPDALTRFHSRAAPGISVVDYLRRIVRYTNCEKIPLLSLLSYIDITCLNLPTFTLSSLTVHRFLIASVCAGSKAQCDVFCTNAHYAKVGGIKTNELNALERELLRVTKWDLCCHAETLQKYYTSLIRSHGGHTQAPPPIAPPFMEFPRSHSKPRPAAESPGIGSEIADEESEIDAEKDGALLNDEDVKDDEDLEMRRGSSDSGDISRHPPSDGMMVVDTQSESISPTISSRGRTKQRRKSKASVTMDIDPTLRPASHSTDLLQSSPYSASGSTASSSSIPSSSRSSIRGGSIKPRGRTISISVSDPRLAEPKVDVTPVMVQGSFEDRSRSSLVERPEQTQGSSGSTTNDSMTAGYTQPHPTSTSTSYPTIPVPQAATSQPASHPHVHHSGPHGRSLKSLVGGIFRRKSLPGDDGVLSSLSTSIATIPAASRRTSGNVSGHVGESAATSGGGALKSIVKTRPHSIIPSKPIHVHLPSFTSTNDNITTSSDISSGITQTRPSTLPIGHQDDDDIDHGVGDGGGGGGGGGTMSRERERGRMETDQSPVSPGFAKPVTPRVRHRDETSLDSPRERMNLGSAGVGVVPPVVGLGIGVSDIDSGKRSKGT
ncbi:hypothetical protein IAR55_006086 [Kwoniella newhampshirensis]|uniref:Alternative cyclin Pho80 n=1 Tax=Kwoniella newhampshirensis TaxID=1651941 RepID=A0AAW0YXM0_9TREE